MSVNFQRRPFKKLYIVLKHSSKFCDSVFLNENSRFYFHFWVLFLISKDLGPDLNICLYGYGSVSVLRITSVTNQLCAVMLC